jgi:hypothetical protein
LIATLRGSEDGPRLLFPSLTLAVSSGGNARTTAEGAKVGGREREGISGKEEEEFKRLFEKQI